MNDQLNQALDEAYAKYLAGCDKRSAPVVWDRQEWNDNSIVAANLRQKFWSVEDNK